MKHFPPTAHPNAVAFVALTFDDLTSLCTLLEQVCTDNRSAWSDDGKAWAGKLLSELSPAWDALEDGRASAANDEPAEGPTCKGK